MINVPRGIPNRWSLLTGSTCIDGDVEELGHEAAVVSGALGQEERGPVSVGQVADVHQDLMAQGVDVQLRADVPDQLHEQLRLRQTLHLLARNNQSVIVLVLVLKV